MNKMCDKQMINKSDNNIHLVNQEVRFNESIRRIIPNAKFICINFYEDSLIEKSLGNIKNLTSCDIIEIVTHISINTKKFGDLIKIAGSEAAFRRWITNFLQKHKFVEEVIEGRNTLFKKTERGYILHKTLEDWRFVVAFKRLSRKRLKRETQVSR